MKSCPRCGQEYADAITLCPADGAVLKQTGDDLIGQTLADKYRIEELISEGGMGAVYRGTHVLMDKTVAVKVLRPSLAADDTIVARFSREAKAASRIAHPHALSVTDFGESENGVVFLVMEYLSGRTLKNEIRRVGPMPLSRVAEIIRQVGSALDAAHAEGVIHRDLKSDNIMLVDSNGADWAKVLDFGIAKIRERVGSYDPGITAPNLIVGTPQYMSPEQCSQSSELDSRSDIYSLGVILYEMLLGHVPFTGESPTAIMMKHLQEGPPSVVEERHDLPASVGRVVAKALAKRPEDRYQSAGQLVEALTDAAGDPVMRSGTARSESRTTDRIVVPTASNQSPIDTATTDYDEITVVSQRAPASAAATRPMAPVSAKSDFNPWRIAIPALAALILLFTGLFVFTRHSGQTNPNDSPLSADPNSQPVTPSQPATGQAEQGIKANGPVAVPSATATPDNGFPTPAVGAEDSNTSANSNSNARELPSPKSLNTNVAAPTPGGKPSPQTSPPLPKPTLAPPPAQLPTQPEP